MQQARIYFACIVMLALTSCGIDDVGQKRSFDDEDLSVNSAVCRKNLKSGCVQGQVIAAPDIYLAGTKYFDAAELALKFKDHLDAKDENGKTVPAKDLDLNFLSKVDNNSFVQDFSVYLKGPVARQDDVFRNGSFALHNLPEGSFDLRVQKTFHIELKAKLKPLAPLDPTQSAEATKPDTEVKPGKEYCVTFFSVLPVDISKDKRTTGIVFDEFEFEVKSCGSDDKPDEELTL